MARVTDGGTEFDPAALERTEARFWREVWDAVPAEVVAAHGVRRREFGPVQATVARDLPEAEALNLLLGAAQGDAAAEGFVEEAIEWVRGEGARGFALLSPGETGVADAEAVLGAAGFERARGWMRFVRDAHPPRFDVAADVKVVEDEDAPFATVAALGLGLPAWAAELFAPLPSLPDWHCYVAKVDGEPAGCAAMLVDGEAAGIGLAATLEGGRGRGCGSALLRRRIEDAAAAGARTLFVDAGERVPGRPSPGYADILRAGFEEAYLRPGWADAHTPGG